MKTLFKLAIITLAFSSCKNIANQNHPISNEVLDTIQSAPKGEIISPTYYEKAFVEGTTKTEANGTMNFYGITMGKIKITSGKIITCDPLHIDEYGIPFMQVFPTGEFPVQLSILKLGEEESIAFARINFSDAPVVKWQQALRPKMKEVPFGGEDIPEYCVDGGVAIFLDEEAAKTLDLAMAADMDGDMFQQMYKHHHVGWRYTMYDFGQHNLAAFTTGLGDGCYPAYIGFDAQGKPCRLLTDFGLFDSKGQ